MKNFCDIPEKYSLYENAKIAIVPVAFDKTSTWIKGSDNGPTAIIEASKKLELYDIETDSEVYKTGIYTDSQIKDETSTSSLIQTVENRVKQHLTKDKFVITFGGEHTVSIGAAKAHANFYKKDFCVLQLDAHADLRNIYYSDKNNHGCVMARIKEFCPIVQVGIRSMSWEEKNQNSKDRIFFAKDIYNNHKWIPNVVNLLSENVYVTIDLDVFDPAVMPSTGTPEPGGLFWYDVIALLKQVANSKNVVGFDVVELCPNEKNKAPDFLAAKLTYKFLSYIFKENKSEQ